MGVHGETHGGIKLRSFSSHMNASSLIAGSQSIKLSNEVNPYLGVVKVIATKIIKRNQHKHVANQIRTLFFCMINASQHSEFFQP